ncbi:hypothetical protein [Streptomyces afghaniensis]|uniref:hypothetical protein n=1 Tax=Streptomyces afghaniensis TaxID=66865 RepID=UPI00278B1CF2|nr:hypothetical protein [Streptomyces afghaniensis]MDQ1016717.1 hypothetical protein [Streptomyces afghaniensis]
MEYTHAAIGVHVGQFVRVDVLWTPGKEGAEVNVRDADSLTSQGVYQAPRLAVLPYTPDTDTLHSVVRNVLESRREDTWFANFAYSLAKHKRFTWVPEKMARVAK